MKDYDNSRIPADTLNTWQAIDDASAGEVAVKRRGERYLPRPNPDDTSPENRARYQQYKDRASFYNATGRTLAGMTGLAFSKPPTVELPATLEYLRTSADGAGVGLDQLAQMAVSNVVGLGRGGFLVDFAETDGGVSQDKILQGGASIKRFHPRQVINWDTDLIDGRRKLSMVVLKETGFKRETGGFVMLPHERWRILELIDGVYRVRVVEQTSSGATESEYWPTDSTGASWKEIPFTFTGSTNNADDIDPAPLADLAFLNLSHYRNSADIEESSFIAGQPTLVISGLTQMWHDQNLKGKTYLGVRSGLSLPKDADAKLIQAEANALPLELMKMKEEQMIRIGARLIEPSRSITATATVSNDKTVNSILSLCVANVSAALTQCLQWCMKFNGGSGAAWYDINREFATAELTAQDLTALVQLWQSGTVAKSDVRALLRDAGKLDPERTDADIDSELESETVPLSQ